jgi:hypothetical protein
VSQTLSSFIAISTLPGSNQCIVSCSDDNLRYFPDFERGLNQSVVNVQFRTLHSRLVRDGFTLKNVTGHSVSVGSTRHTANHHLYVNESATPQ